MKRSYPLTLAAAKKHESSLWELGDALLKECPPDSRHGQISEACEFLRANGCDYEESWLSKLRQTALAFSPKLRRRELAFEVHREAETPKMLEAVIKGAPKGTVISSRFVRKIVGQIYAHEERSRREAQEQAQAKREAAEAEQREKFFQARQAKDEKERNRLFKEHKEAKRRTEEAIAAQQAVRTPPRRNLEPPAKEEVPVLLAEAEFLANADRSIVLAKRSAEVIEGSLYELTAKGVAGLTDAALGAANAWTEAAQIVRKEVVDQRGHLSVMER